MEPVKVLLTVLQSGYVQVHCTVRDNWRLEGQTEELNSLEDVCTFLGLEEEENMGGGDCWLYCLGFEGEIQELRNKLLTDLRNGWSDSLSTTGSELRALINWNKDGELTEDQLTDIFEDYMSAFVDANTAASNFHQLLVCTLYGWDLVIVNSAGNAQYVNHARGRLFHRRSTYEVSSITFICN